MRDGRFGSAHVLANDLLNAVPYGIVVLSSNGVVSAANASAYELLPKLSAEKSMRCHELFSCRGRGGPCERLGCLVERAAVSTGALPEVRIDTDASGSPSALWATAAPLGYEPGTLLHLRAGDAGDRRRRTEPHWLAGPELHIQAFGRMLVESGGSTLGGQWLRERPGQLLKYLVCERHRSVMADEIAEAIWPTGGLRALNNTRHVVHRLRDRLEPGREGHGQSSFVVYRDCGYGIDPRRVRIDVDEFERSVGDGLSALERLDTIAAKRHLEHADDLYRGEFLADEPYADWATDERRRLAGLADRAVRALAALAGECDDFACLVTHLQRLAELEPFDSSVQREFVSALLSAGRRSEAKRHYTAFAQRMRREFGQDPGFDLRSLRPLQRPAA